jgi:Zn-dependent peptidase ImmA (M78 family)
LDVLSDILRKQQWYREYLESIDAKHLEFIGRFAQNSDPIKIANDIRNTLQINGKMREESHNWEQFLQEFIQRSEKIGILVFRNGIVGNNTHRPLNVEEFRGFVISDLLAPVIFINGKDAKTAQIFTLAHELAHLWMGQTGISNPDYFNKLSAPQNIIERVANQAAAEILVPADEFLHFWDAGKEAQDNIEVLAQRYRVSQFVVLRRAFDNGKISEAEYYEYYQRLVAEHHTISGISGGNFFRSLLARNSHTLTTTLLVACAEGSISRKETASLLNVKIKSLPSIQREIIGVAANA